MKKFANLIVVDLGFGHIRKAGLVGTLVGHQGFHLHARLGFCVDHGLHCNQARMADSGHACNRSQFDERHGGDYSAILGEVMHSSDAHARRREQTVIEAWLGLPAWRRLRTTPNLNKPAK